MKSAELRAVDIATDSAEAHFSPAAVDSLLEWEWDSAHHEFKRAIESDPA